MLQRNEDKEERRTMSLGYPRYARNNKTEYRLTEKLVALIPIERLVFHFPSSFHVGLVHALHRLVCHFVVVVVVVIAIVVVRVILLPFFVAVLFIVNIRIRSHVFNVILVDGLARRDDNVPVCALELL